MLRKICRMLGYGAVLILMATTQLHAQTCEDWPLWSAFNSRFVQGDGRVLADESEQRYSTSEGQAYALFFSLVVNDRAAFDRILLWTRNNLAGGNLGAGLPAWQWGKKADGSWGVVDPNSASDADIWLAYTLLEAGRLWHDSHYSAMGNLLLANIRIHLIRDYPGAGAMLLPAATGFDLDQGGTRLNASYVPVQLLRSFTRQDPSGPWDAVILNNLRLVQASSAKGFVPDWVAYIPGKGYQVDPKQDATGAHDAIRVYLWWGMLSRHDSMSSRLKKLLFGMNRLIPKHQVSPPLTVDAQSGEVLGMSPPSFSAALLPYFATMENDRALKLQQERLLAEQDAATGVLVGRDLRYYDQVLTLFGQGWIEHRFSFSSQGQLVVQWKPSCSAKN